jgi:hypothetical protein
VIGWEVVDEGEDAVVVSRSTSGVMRGLAMSINITKSNERTAAPFCVVETKFNRDWDKDTIFWFGEDTNWRTVTR